MYVAVGDGTERFELLHWHLEPDVGIGIGWCEGRPAQVYYLSILLYSEKL